MAGQKDYPDYPRFRYDNIVIHVIPRAIPCPYQTWCPEPPGPRDETRCTPETDTIYSHRTPRGWADADRLRQWFEFVRIGGRPRQFLVLRPEDEGDVPALSGALEEAGATPYPGEPAK